MYHLQPLQQRLLFLVVLLTLPLLVIIGRLFYLQVSWTDHYLDRGEKNFLRIETIPPRRGAIYDCHGNLLATNRPITNLSWQGSGNYHLSGKQLELLHHLAKVTDTQLTPALINSISQTERQYKSFEIARDVRLDQLSKITERYPEDPNLAITTQFERYYPYGSYASHIVGYLSKQIDTPNGIMGLEKICDEIW